MTRQKETKGNRLQRSREHDNNTSEQERRRARAHDLHATAVDGCRRDGDLEVHVTARVRAAGVVARRVEGGVVQAAGVDGCRCRSRGRFLGRGRIGGEDGGRVVVAGRKRRGRRLGLAVTVAVAVRERPGLAVAVAVAVGERPGLGVAVGVRERGVGVRGRVAVRRRAGAVPRRRVCRLDGGRERGRVVHRDGDGPVHGGGRVHTRRRLDRRAIARRRCGGRCVHGGRVDERIVWRRGDDSRFDGHYRGVGRAFNRGGGDDCAQQREEGERAHRGDSVEFCFL